MKRTSLPFRPSIRRLLLALCLGCVALGASAAPVKPNVVFILADDLGYGDVRCLNPDGRIPTPNLDRLAAEGMIFTDAHSSSAVCTPTRYGILTGRYNWRSRLKQGVQGGMSPPLIEPGRLTLPAFLQRQGYHTACIGKWHLGMDWPLLPGAKPFNDSIEKGEEGWNVDFSRPITGGPNRVGFDYFFGISASLDMVPYTFIENDRVTRVPTETNAFAMMSGRPGRLTRRGPATAGFTAEEVLPTLTRKAVTYLEQRAATPGRPPFFLYVPLNAPHTPIAPTAAWKGRSGLNPYADFVMQTDAEVGVMLDALQRLGLASDTLVVFTSDNGCSPEAKFDELIPAGHHPSAQFRGSKADIFDGGHRVPFIARWPGRIPAGRTSSQLICLNDTFATCADLLGQRVPDNAAEDSVSLVPALEGRDTRPLREALVHHSINGSFAIRQGDWKLELCPDSGGWSEPRPGTPAAAALPRVQLYDIRRDAGETNNLAATHPEVVARLSALLKTYVDNGRSTPGAAQTNTTPVRLPPVASASKPNVLFIAIDDQNDWIGAFGGHPLAKTPNIDRLARRGTIFLNAHCNAPLCNPSRTSLMLGLRPTTTGIYGLAPWFRTLDAWRDRVTLPQHFRAEGYRTFTSGKIYHGGVGNPAARAAEFDVWGPDGGIGVKPAAKLVGSTPMGDNALMDWGVFPHRDEDKGDYQVASWTIGQIRSMPAGQPFFLAAGFFLPHVPCYATQKWFDLYPDDDRVLPVVQEHDRDDTPRFSWYLHWSLPEPRLKWMQEHHQWRNLVRSYLACTSFVDAQVGRIVDALDDAGLSDNTIIVLWGDHGWHLGEKGITGKNTLWDRGTKVPLLFAGPGIRPGGRCVQPVELLDIYPSLIELCGLPLRQDLEGLSLVPQLQDAGARRERPAITSHNQGNHGVRSDGWRYIRYADGAEELYNMRNDPREWTNLAGRPEFSAELADHRRWLPTVDLPPAPGSAHRVLTYNAANDEATWEGGIVRRTDPIPE